MPEVIIQAQKKKYLSRIKPEIDKMQITGFRLSEDLIKKVLEYYEEE